MKEFEVTLKNMSKGNLTLVSQLASVQLAMRATVSKAFQTPEIIKLFAKNQPKQLRVKLNELERDHKLGKIEGDVYTQQVTEILSALQKLGDQLTESEKEFLGTNMSAELKTFVAVDNSGAQINTSSVTSQIENAKK
ncbi:beta-catenin-interacting protein [Acrasis kona]|uniref:Beta-catenin-interacting protein n=1 Tax=Acrasis kona TaxID=1008807 RepID=A0AAW2Z453_9EUKA